MGAFVRAGAAAFLRAVLGFYFRRIELLGPERVPAAGPLLVCANHPNSLADAMVLSAALPRPLHIVATAALFRLKPVAALLRAMRVIAVNRASDDPRAMRSVTATFEAVYAVLEAGGAVLIFPEGITYDEPALRELKSGAARMALELESRHAGRLGLKVLPVGLAYSARGRYRGDALASVGEPLRAGDFLEGYPERKKECIGRLSAALDAAIKALVVHQPDPARAGVAAGMMRLLRDEAGLEGALGRKRVADAVERAFEARPAEAAAFAARLAAYEQALAGLGVDDSAVAAWSGTGIGGAGTALRGLAAVVLAPAALWGAAHRWLPLTLTAWAVERFADPERLEARIATRALLAGSAAFMLCYGLCIMAVKLMFGWTAALWYGLSLPVCGLLAHAYGAELLRLAAQAGGMLRLYRSRAAAAELSGRRAGLLEEARAWRAAG